MSWHTINDLVIIGSFLALALQTRSLRLQIARGEMQSVYNRYLEITKIEVADPALHKMFLYGRDFDVLSGLSADELHQRALSLLIFDQFALIFNMSHERSFSRTVRWLRDKPGWESRRRYFASLYDRRRSIWEINSDYISGVLTNPMLVKSWRDWGLGDTWKGSGFYDFVEGVLDRWQLEQGGPTGG